MKISSAFPLYEQFDPAIPIHCVTPNEGACMHRFFDTSPVSASGRFLASFRMPFEDRLPGPGEKGQVVVTNLETAEERIVAETAGWEPQMGANLQWLGTSERLIFNDVDPESWAPYATVLDPTTGESKRLGGCVYQASPDGRYAASSRMSSMRRTQTGYGVTVPDELCPLGSYLPDDDGLYLTDTETGACNLLVSIRQCFMDATPKVDVSQFENWQFYGFHTKWCPSGERLIFTVRWFEGLGEEKYDMLGNCKFNVFTLRPDGTEIHNAVPWPEWEKGGHHINFFPDGKSLSMNLGFDEYRKMKLVRVGYDGSNLSKITDAVPGSGHPTVHPDGRHILTDSYGHEPMAFGDGTTPLRWIDYKAGTETVIARIHTASPHQKTHSCLRIDPHPAWDRQWEFVSFNAFVDGTRRVYVADMRSLL